MAHDLDFLNDVKPVLTDLLESPRKVSSGPRKPHPLTQYVEMSRDTGRAVALPMTVKDALACSRIVRNLAKKLGAKGAHGCNVQCLNADPADADTTRDNVIPLTKLKDEPEDDTVWLSFKVVHKGAETTAVDNTGEDTNEDPRDTVGGETDQPDVLSPFATVPTVINP